MRERQLLEVLMVPPCQQGGLHWRKEFEVVEAGWRYGWFLSPLEGDFLRKSHDQILCAVYNTQNYRWPWRFLSPWEGELLQKDRGWIPCALDEELVVGRTGGRRTRRRFEPVEICGMVDGLLRPCSRIWQRIFAVFPAIPHLRSEICPENFPKMRFDGVDCQEKVDQDREQDSDVCANNRARFPAH